MSRLEEFDELTARMRKYLECGPCKACPYVSPKSVSCTNLMHDDLRELLKLFPRLEVTT